MRDGNSCWLHVVQCLPQRIAELPIFAVSDATLPLPSANCTTPRHGLSARIRLPTIWPPASLPTMAVMRNGVIGLQNLAYNIRRLVALERMAAA